MYLLGRVFLIYFMHTFVLAIIFAFIAIIVPDGVVCGSNVSFGSPTTTAGVADTER